MHGAHALHIARNFVIAAGLFYAGGLAIGIILFERYQERLP